MSPLESRLPWKPEVASVIHAKHRFSAPAAGLALTLALLSPSGAHMAAASPVTCQDGSIWPKAGRGACRGHGGVDPHKSTAASAPKAAAAAAAATAVAAPVVAQPLSDAPPIPATRLTSRRFNSQKAERK